MAAQITTTHGKQGTESGAQGREDQVGRPVAIEDLIPDAQIRIVSADDYRRAHVVDSSRVWWRVGVAEDGTTFLC